MHSAMAIGVSGALPAAGAAGEGTQPPAPAAPEPVLPFVTSPVDIGGRAQLFVDQSLVRSVENVWFAPVPARKHRANPLLKNDQPWEGWRLELFGSVLYDAEEKLFKMWYLAAPSDYWDDYTTAYAVSKDGIRWEKPPVGTLAAKNGKAGHNLVCDAYLGVIKDADDPDPARRYKGVGFHPKTGGYVSYVSADGLNWNRYSEGKVVPGRDCITFYYDRRAKLYVTQAKIEQPIPNLPHKRRAFYLSVSADFKNWSPQKLSFASDPRDDAGTFGRVERSRASMDVPDDPSLMRTEFYNLGFHQTESGALAFPWVFSVSARARYDRNNQEGPGEIQMASTRDLLNWERPFRTPIVPRGSEGEWDSGFFTTAYETVTVGDEVRLYYSGGNYTHGTPVLYRDQVDGVSTGRGTKYHCWIGLASWQRDRFAAACSGSDGGYLETVPVVFSGGRCEVNAATTGAGGSVVVEIWDAVGARRLDRSRAISGDDLRHQARWEGEADVAALAGTPVTLRFHLKKARLFAFAFRP